MEKYGAIFPITFNNCGGIFPVLNFSGQNFPILNPPPNMQVGHGPVQTLCTAHAQRGHSGHSAQNAPFGGLTLFDSRGDGRVGPPLSTHATKAHMRVLPSASVAPFSG